MALVGRHLALQVGPLTATRAQARQSDHCRMSAVVPNIGRRLFLQVGRVECQRWDVEQCEQTFNSARAGCQTTPGTLKSSLRAQRAQALKRCNTRYERPQ
eukprot:5566535-Alexandrium_andersonii.AAC.1